MGQHKRNPTAIAAERGELPPKPKKMGKREWKRRLYAECAKVLCARFMETTAKRTGGVKNER